MSPGPRKFDPSDFSVMVADAAPPRAPSLLLTSPSSHSLGSAAPCALATPRTGTVVEVRPGQLRFASPPSNPGPSGTIVLHQPSPIATQGTVMLPRQEMLKELTPQPEPRAQVGPPPPEQYPTACVTDDVSTTPALRQLPCVPPPSQPITTRAPTFHELATECERSWERLVRRPRWHVPVMVVLGALTAVLLAWLGGGVLAT